MSTTQRLPTVHSVSAVEPEPELEQDAAISEQDAASSEQVHLRLGHSPRPDDESPHLQSGRAPAPSGSSRSERADARMNLRAARRSDEYVRQKRHRPDDMLGFWCMEEFTYLIHEQRHDGDLGSAHHLRHTLHRRDLLKLLNDNRSELLRHIKPVGPAAEIRVATVSSSAAARAKAGADSATPRPRAGTAAPTLNQLRGSGSDDSLSSLARGSGSIDIGVGVGSSTQQADGGRGSVAAGHGRAGRAQIRDLRLLDVASSHQNRVGKPAIWVRHSCILVSMEGFRCAIMRQRLLLFSVPTLPSFDHAGARQIGGTALHKPGAGKSRSGEDCDNASERAVVEDIAERLHECSQTSRSSSNNSTTNSTSSSGNNNLVSGNEFMPFELRAFELFLEEAVWRLEDDFSDLEAEVKRAIALIQSTTPGGLGAMHRAKRALLLYVTRAQDMHDVLENLLGDPEDLAAMHLTDRRLFEGNRRMMTQTDSFYSWKANGGGGTNLEDLEDLIEIYSDTASNLLQAGRQLEEEVKDTEELVSLQLDTQRNKILGVEMIITIISSGFALGAFVVGIFGMNFQWQGSFMEKRADEDTRGGNLFVLTVAVTCATMAIGAIGAIAILKNRFPKLWSLE